MRRQDRLGGLLHEYEPQRDDWVYAPYGPGTELLVRLIRRARAAGVRHFSALMLSDNREALELIEHVAPELSRGSSSGVMELVFDLPDRPHLLTAEPGTHA